MDPILKSENNILKFAVTCLIILYIIIIIIHCLNPSNSIYTPNIHLSTNTRITRQHILLRTEKPRTHFFPKLPRHHFIELWNNLDYNIQNLKPKHKFKSVLSK